MTRPSAKRTDLASGPASSEAAEEAPVTAQESASPFPAAAATDDGQVPPPTTPEPVLPVPAKTADDLQFEARLERLYEEARVKEAAQAVEMAELRAQLHDMAAQLGRVVPAGPSEITIRSPNVNQDIFAKGWAARVPGRKPEDAPILGKTFKVIPKGQSAKLGMPIATVTNCSDAGDAKAVYAMKLGRDAGTITVDVQLLTDSAAA